MSSLRPYQQSGIESLRQSFARGNRRIVFKLPTGGGKTVIAENIISMATSKGKRVAFICNRIELAKQTSRRFAQAGIQHGLMQGDNSHSFHSQVMICSIQTMARRRAQDFDLLIIDEAHGVAGSEAYKNLLFALNNVPVIGLTATPYAKGMAKHYDELKGKLFEDMVIGATIQDLIADKFLVEVDIFAPDSYQPDLSNVRTVAGDYDEKELGEAVDKPKLVGDIVAHWQKLGRGKPTIVFATNIAHSKHITEQFLKAGIKAEHIDCYTSEDDRTAILNRVRNHETTIISNAAMLAEGLDIPQLEVMILARPTKSLTRYIQQAGRILRPYPGKERALLLDHSGTCSRLGFPTDDIHIELDDGKPKAKTESKPKEKLPKVCDSCGALKQPGVHKCPACGFEPSRMSDIEHEEGDLKPMTRKDRADLSMADKQAIYSALIGWVESKGRNPGWAYHLYFEMMGVNVSGQLEKRSGPMVEGVQKWLQHRNIKHAKSKTKKPVNTCHKCGSHNVKISSGVGPHAARSDCLDCKAWRWVAKEQA